MFIDLKAAICVGKTVLHPLAEQQNEVVNRAFEGAHSVGLTYRLQELGSVYDEKEAEVEVWVKLKDGGKHHEKHRLTIK